MENDEKYFRLKAIKNLSDDSIHDIDEFQKRIASHALQLITELYGEQLLTIESGGFKEILDTVSQHTTKLAVDLNNTIYKNKAA
ncbi:hypothetical protein BH09BAC2_BH09BAC2_13730 [soil metagenome]